MSLAMVVLIAVLFGSGTYLLLHRTLTRIVLGVGMLANGVNVLIVATSGPPGDAPIVGRDGATDSVPQALVLTAIVIGFATTGFLIELALRSRHESGTDHVDGRDTVVQERA